MKCHEISLPGDLRGDPTEILCPLLNPWSNFQPLQCNFSPSSSAANKNQYWRQFMKNHGVIFRKIREQKSLTIEPLSKIDEREFQRILEVCNIPNNPRLFGIWVASSKKKPTQAIKSDGAILKHLRQKKNLSLSTVAQFF